MSLRPSRAAQIKRMSELLEHGERSLKKAFLESVRGIKDSITITHITKMLTDGDVEGAIRYLDRVIPWLFRTISRSAI